MLVVVVAMLAVAVPTRPRAARARLNFIIANSDGVFLDEDFLMRTRGAWGSFQVAMADRACPIIPKPKAPHIARLRSALHLHFPSVLI